MPEYTALRNVINGTQSPITASTENHSKDLRSYCSGSSSSAPPWTTNFATIYDTTATWNGTTGGTVGAMKIRYWRLRVWNDGGDEGWTGSNPSSGPFDRTEVRRHDPVVLTHEEDAAPPPEEGG